jgi:aldehyde dehydrogenase (NAD+)
VTTGLPKETIAGGGVTQVTSAIEPADVAATVAGLRATFATGRTKDAAWRIRQLRAMERMLDEREHEIATALAKDLGRVPAEAWLGDVAPAKAEAAFARKHLRTWAKRHRTSLPLSLLPGRGWYQYEPLGVVLVIGPWNYPFYLTLGPLVAAVSAGNCAVIKPSEHAPASSGLLAILVPQYLDAEAVAVAEGDAAVTQALLAQGFDHAFFTGGTETGRRVMQAAAPYLTPVTLELGGKSPVIVMRDADLEVAARRIAWVKLVNSGQTCVAPDYVLVERPVRDGLVDALVKTVRAFRADEPAPTMRIVNRQQYERLVAMIANSDGELVLGGRGDADRLGIEPTVIVDPSPDSPVMGTEIFGPVLPVLTVDSLEEVIQFVNTRPKPLATYLFTKSAAERDRVLAEISCGGVVINHVAMHCLAPQLPFGGVGASGMGAYHGRWGFETLSHRKAVLAKPSRPDLPLAYPPYTGQKLKLLRRFF